MIDAYQLQETELYRPRTRWLWSLFILAGGAIIGNQVVAGGPMVRVIVAVVIIGVLAVPAIEQPRRALLGLFWILPFLGTIRHMFVASTGAAFLDPLLLITSAVALTIFISLALNKEIDFSGTFLAKLVFFLLVIGLLQVFNPGQGNLLVGLTGIMINLIPISFFFIGRSVADHAFTQKVYRIVLVVGTIAALYGLSQVFFGFRGFERTWLARQGYTAAQVGETARPFSVFNNAAEYAAYAHYAFVAAFAALLFTPKGRRYAMLAAAGAIFYGGFLTGSRGFTVKALLAIIIVLAARAREHRVLATAIVVILSTAAVYWSATTTSTTTIQAQEQGAGQLVEQQLRALRDPFNRERSTLPVHFEHATTGIKFAITQQPAGLGTGATTRGGAKFGGLQAGTELDIGDAFLALGVLGGAIYIAVIIAGVTIASRVRRALPGPVWIAVWGMAVTSIGAWLTGGNYAVTPLIWFFIGAADGEYKRLRDRGLLRSTLFGALRPNLLAPR